ncbi:MAG: alanine:cation symporter family protein [Planctomycetales bacterium]|nr:alanine:cation symporter family protein [Planctomycetales bacterium]
MSTARIVRRLALSAVLGFLFLVGPSSGGVARAQVDSAADAPTDEAAIREAAPDANSAVSADGKAETATDEVDGEPVSWIRRQEKHVDELFGKWLVEPLASVLFFNFWSDQWLLVNEKTGKGVSVPFVVLWLLFGAVFFTLRMGFINVRAFRHALHLVRGDYDDPDDEGEVSHFQALSSALSATVGLGNIAGVAIAVGKGGPGAVFWMIVAGLFGMSSKFTECTLAQMYRRISPDGTISGGPMHYLKEGLSTVGTGGTRTFMQGLGVVLSIMFTIMCIGGSFGGGCAFQVNQSLGALKAQFPDLVEWGWLYGVLMMVAVGVVIIGGIRRIAATAEKVVPTMCAIYLLTALYIVLSNYDKLGAAIETIVLEAFSWESVYGGFLGVMVVGVQRAAFSNEAGIGSAAIAHSAARTDEPIREGIVALLEPFIDTVVVCTMTGLVIVITGAYNNPEYADLIDRNQGAVLTSEAFGHVVRWFPTLLSIAVVLFAYSTLISWSYYGERCWSYLFGDRAGIVYKILFLVFVFLGSVVTATNVLDFSDLMILSMGLPNILGVVLLSGRVRRALDDYWGRYRAGEVTRDR